MAFDQAAAQRLLGEVFAGWVQDLGLTVEQVGTGNAVLRMRFSERLCRDNGVFCGQAIMSLADTAMVFAVSAAAGGYGPMTTVDQTIHFLRPIANADTLAEARVLRFGRTMAFGQVTIAADGDARPAATAQAAYALLAGKA
ncbi:MAG TPA: PaaI family thioesterase [Beijerinckiaceae bacterium]|nr:PaaI family thioesterase [Beijerinckiaceae bacterium]